MNFNKMNNETMEEYLVRIGVFQEHDQEIVITDEELEADENGNVKE
ncbi:hypothetical protein SAMN02745174_02575 [Cetobacterium ceti]|uniref:Uncharacterized protein n=1 Tax=Cetobacterium ceti TaxID=180163 RepID=A0A1T4R503_9FUSO|nr:hypothetical protein [Cetobacterium ceti]SKA10955.1 hypothetical protein SAMN02745174_02575 [Cetobacterium ceti]